MPKGIGYPKKSKVFLTGGFETGSGKPQVSFAKKSSNILGTTKEFETLAKARVFAAKKARELGEREFLADLQGGTKLIQVNDVNFDLF